MVERRSNAAAILFAGLAAALLDILDPIIFYGLRGIRAIRIPQSIASGLLGRAAFSGGTETALLGMALHLGIALFWAALFVAVARFIPVLFRHPAVSGLLYGGIIYLVMNYVVLPHSRVLPSLHPTPAVLINGVCAMLFLVGLPIALINRRFAPLPTRVSS